jgi:hypothetical protein
VDHDLIALPRRAGIQLVMQRGLGQQGQSIGLLPEPRRTRARRGRAPRPAPAGRWRTLSGAKFDEVPSCLTWAALAPFACEGAASGAR